jgi:hypothetical protein
MMKPSAEGATMTKTGSAGALALDTAAKVDVKPRGSRKSRMASKKTAASSSSAGNASAHRMVDGHIDAKKTSSTPPPRLPLPRHAPRHNFNSAASALEKLSVSAASMAQLQETEGREDDNEDDWDDGFFKMPSQAKPEIVDGPAPPPPLSGKDARAGVLERIGRHESMIASLEEKIADTVDDLQSTGMVGRATAGEMKALRVDFETKISLLNAELEMKALKVDSQTEMSLLNAELAKHIENGQRADENIEALATMVKALQKQNSRFEAQFATQATKLAEQEAALLAFGLKNDGIEALQKQSSLFETRFVEQETRMDNSVHGLHRAINSSDERYVMVAEELAVMKADVNESLVQLKDERNQIASGIVELLREESSSSNRIFESQILRTVATIKELKLSLESSITELWQRTKTADGERAKIAQNVEKQRAAAMHQDEQLGDIKLFQANASRQSWEAARLAVGSTEMVRDIEREQAKLSGLVSSHREATFEAMRSLSDTWHKAQTAGKAAE